MTEELVNVTIDGVQIAVPKGTTIIEAAKQRRRAGAALLLSPVVALAGGLPDVPGRGREGPQAPAGVRHRGGGGPGGARGEPQGQGRTPERAGVPAHQPSARLPHLRSGRRVRAAGLRLPGGPGRHPVRRVRQALQPSRGLRPRHPVCAQPVHPLHPVRAVHGGRRRRPDLERLRARRPGIHRHRRRPAAGSSLGGQRRGSLPGRLAPLQGLPAQGARLGPRQDGERLPGVHPGLQHQRGHPGRRGRPAPSAAQSRRQPALHLRLRPVQLPLDEPGRPGRGAAGP